MRAEYSFNYLSRKVPLFLISEINNHRLWIHLRGCTWKPSEIEGKYEGTIRLAKVSQEPIQLYNTETKEIQTVGYHYQLDCRMKWGRFLRLLWFLLWHTVSVQGIFIEEVKG